MRGFLIFILLAFSLNLFATYQRQDTLVYNGKKYTVHLGKNAFSCSPLSLYYAQNNIEKPFRAWSSGVSRNHIATWIVKDSCFYLKNIHTIDGDKTFEECLVKSKDTIQNTPSLLFADWYSGIVSAGGYCFKIKYGRITAITEYYCGAHKYRFFILLLDHKDSIKMKKDYGRLDIGYYKKNPIFDYYGKEDILDFPYNWESDSLFGVPFCKWEIRKKKIYLKYLELYSFSNRDTIDIQKEFPDKTYKRGIFADWINGVYRIEMGEMVTENPFDDYEYTYFKVEEHNYLRIVKGVVTESLTVKSSFNFRSPPKDIDPQLLKLIEEY